MKPQILKLIFLGSPVIKFSIALLAFASPPSIGTRQMFALQPRHGIVNPKRASRTVTAFGNLHDGQATSITPLSKLNI
jgi:hypothetical protein